MKEIFLKILCLIVMWLMIIITTFQGNTVLWLVLAIITFLVIHFASKWTRVTDGVFPGLKCHKAWGKYLSIGVAIGSAYSIIRFLILYNTGAIKVLEIFPLSTNAAAIATLTLLASNCYIALAEEFVFRGYIISALPSTMNRNIAIGISASLFILAHSVNGLASFSRIIELLFLSLTLTVIYIKTESLWTAIGLHLGLDFFSFFLGGDGDASRQYILLSEKTPDYENLMRLTDSVLPVMLFLLVVLLTGIILKTSLNRINR